LNVVNEVVTNYDIDAIHFDDYFFYPYRIPGEAFNSASSFKYGNGMTLKIGDVISIVHFECSGCN
jgi:uncharacterized lipoprotein YddW (UPF0748 family)